EHVVAAARVDGAPVRGPAAESTVLGRGRVVRGHPLRRGDRLRAGGGGGAAVEAGVAVRGRRGGVRAAGAGAALPAGGVGAAPAAVLVLPVPGEVRGGRAVLHG